MYNFALISNVFHKSNKILNNETGFEQKIFSLHLLFLQIYDPLIGFLLRQYFICKNNILRSEEKYNRQLLIITKS